MLRSLVGSEMCIRDRLRACLPGAPSWFRWSMFAIGSLAPTVFWILWEAVNGAPDIGNSHLFGYVVLLAIAVPMLLWGAGRRWYVPGCVLRVWWQQCLLSMAVLVFYCTVYVVLTEFLHAYLSDGQTSTGYRTYMWYAAFLVINQLLKITGKRLGRLVDTGKQGAFVMYFALEFMCSLFYYTFYRTLFEHFGSYTTLAVFLALHLGHEWLIYVFRATSAFFEIYSRWAEPAGTTARWLLEVLLLPPGDLTLRDVQHCVAIELALRWTASAYSFSAFTLFLLISRRGWAQSQYYCSAECDSSMPFIFLTIGLVCEFANVVLMEVTFFRPNRCTIFQVYTAKQVLAQQGFFLYCMFVSVCLSNNIVFPLELYADGVVAGQRQCSGSAR
eukprot:TRINITY_DN16041_c0_g1_i2.p1 TRINITY_DN16041_c0_g1~~TRINITY_DN16041_c0_g1_i2.p1  ORF type:complete len:386 (-),score=79.35 TRINITY_DN16041_c0_g1_i2:319-1476(-)